MNVFNRILVIILAIGALLLVIVAALAPFQFFAAVAQVSESLAAGFSQFYQASPFIFRLAQAAITVAAIVVCGLLLALELRPGQPRAVRVLSGDGARASVLVDSVSQRLIYHLDQLADVISVRPRVKGRGDMVDVFVEVETTPDVDVPMKTQEILHVVREIIEGRMGLKLGNVDIRMKHAPYPPGVAERGLMESAQ